MNKLFELARNAFRRVLQRRSGTQNIRPKPPLPPGNLKSRTGAPPIETAPKLAMPPRKPTGPASSDLRDIAEVEAVYTELQLYGRDRGHSDQMQSVMDGMRRVTSSNVYGYFFELEKPGKGLLYVTFLGQSAQGARTASPGATYVYYDVPTSKFDLFQRASDSSAGAAVWDYLRQRGSSWEHQHRYRLIQTAGDYVPRKAWGKVDAQGNEQRGFRTRHLAPVGQVKIPNSIWSAISRLEHSADPKVRDYAGRMKRDLLATNQIRASTLAPRSTLAGRATLAGRTSLAGRSSLPNRGTPSRGAPNRG